MESAAAEHRVVQREAGHHRAAQRLVNKYYGRCLAPTRRKASPPSGRRTGRSALPGTRFARNIAHGGGRVLEGHADTSGAASPAPARG